MKTKLLNSAQLKSLLPAILKEWNNQEYPSILACSFKVLLTEKNRPPELVFAIVANAAEQWLEAYLEEHHSATVPPEDRKIAIGAMMNEVVEKTR